MSVDRLAALRGLRPERVCLIKPSSLGDVVHALPVLSALRTLWPGAHLAWVVNRGLRGLLDGHPDLDEVIPFDRSGTVASMGRFLLDLRRRRFDLAIDLQGLFRSGLMAFASGAPVRVGLAGTREGSGLFYHHRVDVDGKAHAVDRLLAVAEAFGADTATPRFRVATSLGDLAWARAKVGGSGRPMLAVNVGARWLTKRWPPGHFAAVARRAAEERGAGVVVVGAPEDRPLADAFLDALGSVGDPVDLCGKTTLPRLAGVAAAVDVFLSNDTGPLHLAAAAGARVVGVYTCTSPLKTGPYGPNALAVRSCVWCAPSYRKTCPRLECMAELTPARVWTAVEAQLDAAAQNRRIAG